MVDQRKSDSDKIYCKLMKPQSLINFKRKKNSKKGWFMWIQGVP